jgi:hypothetical protein
MHARQMHERMHGRAAPGGVPPDAARAVARASRDFIPPLTARHRLPAMQPSPRRRKLLLDVRYATATGTSRELAERLGRPPARSGRVTARAAPPDVYDRFTCLCPVPIAAYAYPRLYHETGMCGLARVCRTPGCEHSPPPPPAAQ